MIKKTFSLILIFTLLISSFNTNISFADEERIPISLTTESDFEKGVHSGIDLDTLEGSIMLEKPKEVPEEQFAWAIKNDTGTIVRQNLLTGEIKQKDYPYKMNEIVVDPDGNAWTLVSNKTKGYVCKIDVNTLIMTKFKVEDLLLLKIKLSGLALHPNGKKIMVAGRRFNSFDLLVKKSIYLLDITTGEVVEDSTTVDVDCAVIDLNGYYWAGSKVEKNMIRVDANNYHIKSVRVGLFGKKKNVKKLNIEKFHYNQRVNAINLDKNNNIYIGGWKTTLFGYGNPVIRKIDGDTKDVVFERETDVPSKISGIIVDKDSDIWIITSDNNNVYRYSSTLKLKAIIILNSKIDNLVALDIDEDEHVLIQSKTGLISKIDPEINEEVYSGEILYSKKHDNTKSNSFLTKNFAGPQKPEHGTWNYVFDSEKDLCQWNSVNWDDYIPSDFSLTFEVAISNKRYEFNNFVLVNKNQSLLSLSKGRYLKIRATLKREVSVAPTGDMVRIDKIDVYPEDYKPKYASRINITTESQFELGTHSGVDLDTIEGSIMVKKANLNPKKQFVWAITKFDGNNYIVKRNQLTGKRTVKIYAYSLSELVVDAEGNAWSILNYHKKGYVCKIDIETLETTLYLIDQLRLQNIDLGGIAVHPNGNVIVASKKIGSERIYLLTPSTGKVVSKKIGPNVDFGIIDDNGYYWGGSKNLLGNMIKVNVNNETLDVEKINFGQNVSSITIDKDNYIYISGKSTKLIELGSNRIKKIDADTNNVVRDIKSNIPANIRGITVTDSDDVWVVTSDNDRVYKYSSDLILKTVILPNSSMEKLIGIDTDGDNNVLIQGGNGKISRINSQTNVVEYTEEIFMSDTRSNKESSNFITKDFSSTPGSEHGIWEYVVDSHVDQCQWDKVDWINNTANDFDIKFEIASSEDGTNFGSYIESYNSEKLLDMPLGRYLKIKVTMNRKSGVPGTGDMIRIDDINIFYSKEQLIEIIRNKDQLIKIIHNFDAKTKRGSWKKISWETSDDSNINVSYKNYNSETDSDTVDWNSAESNEEINKNGFRFLKVKIILKTDENGIYPTIHNIDVVQNVPVVGVRIISDKYFLFKDTTLKLGAKIYSDDATNKTLIWSSSDNSKATVNSQGHVIGTSNEQGEVTITVTTQDGGYEDSVTLRIFEKNVDVQ